MNVDGVIILSRFSALDWCILAAMPALVIVIGLLARRHVRGMDDFVIAGRTVRPRLGVASIIASEMGLMTFMFAAQRGLTDAFSAFFVAVLSGGICLAVAMTGLVAHPLRRIGARTIPEFYGRRFSQGVRICGGAVLVAAGVLSVGVVIQNGSLFLLSLVGVSSTRLPTAVGVMMGVVVLYTMLGGMISVIIKDYLQFVLLAAGLLLTMMISLHEMQWNNIFETIDLLRGRGGFNPFHPESSWLADKGLDTLWLAMVLVGSCTVLQPLMLRICATQNVPAMKRTFRWASLGFLMRMLIPMFIGILSLVYLAGYPDMRAAILYAGRIGDQQTARLATATFLGQILPPGVLGLVGAAMVGAFLSALDGCLVSWASVLSQDVLAPLYRRTICEARQITMARALIPLLAMTMLAWGLCVPLTYDLWHYVFGLGALYMNGALPILILGLYWKRASTAGAYAALLAGMGSLLGLKPVQAAIGVTWQASLVHLITLAGCFAAMIVVSLLRPSRPADEHWNAEHPSARPPAVSKRSRVEIAPDTAPASPDASAGPEPAAPFVQVAPPAHLAEDTDAT